MDADLRPSRPEASLGDLTREATEHMSTLMRDEIALAKSELREDVQDAVAGISLFSAAGVMALIAILLLSMAAGFGVGRAVGEGWQWLGFAAVGVLYLVIAGIAALMGRKKAQEIPPPAPRTTRQARETVQAAKEIKL
ncbi:phage holin family protein [Euzebya sp.]|uniref:phage holin family protein n=1 Tax=Euzebya sp. TaxID=1971409 RepID=UPI0035151D8B